MSKGTVELSDLEILKLDGLLEVEEQALRDFMGTGLQRPSDQVELDVVCTTRQKLKSLKQTLRI